MWLALKGSVNVLMTGTQYEHVCVSIYVWGGRGA